MTPVWSGLAAVGLLRRSCAHQLRSLGKIRCVWTHGHASQVFVMGTRPIRYPVIQVAYCIPLNLDGCAGPRLHAGRWPHSRPPPVWGRFL